MFRLAPSPRLPAAAHRVGLATLVLAAACEPSSEASKPPEAEQPATTKLSSDHPAGREVLAALDEAADPCQDFYEFACGGWLATHELPADEPRYTRGFSMLEDQNNATLRTIMEGARGREGELGKVGAYYQACMDEPAIDGRGLAPLDPYLARIATIKDAKSMMRVVGELHGTVFAGGGPLFAFGRGPDLEDPALYISHLAQGGTGLPDRSYYLEEAKKQQILAPYTAHVARMLTLYGDSEAEAATKAAAIVAFETRLAEVQTPQEDLRDPTVLVHRWNRGGLHKRVRLDWKGYFTALGHPKIDAINVMVPQFFEALPKILADTDPAVMRDYLRWHLISSTAGLLPKKVVDTNFTFASALMGTKELPPRWERCVDATTGALPDAVGKAFVEQTFAGDSREISLRMIRDVEKAFEGGLASLAWMDDPTRTKAVEKMNAIDNKVGYPDKWKEYERLTVGADYFANGVAAREFEYQRDLAKVGQPIDRQEWTWPVSIVNAGYDPSTNDMMFPAGILQPPFFSKEFPTAMNYGAMGMVMGHELTHGFDDSGRKFDGAGRLREWWAPDVAQRFEEKARCIDETYSAIEIQPGVSLNGKLTLGENIADFGGLKSAFEAYRRRAADEATSPPLIDGLTDDRLFFVAFAQAWCTVSSPEYDRLAATVDPHSPPEQRVNVTLAHMPRFWEAFQCGEGSPMHAARACGVW